jgi:2-dehydro-3-deoxygalactonokinase
MTPDWIAVDWGTSNLRVWAMQGDTIVAKGASDEGMGQLLAQDFEPALLRLAEPWLSDTIMPVIACGMVGSRQGWQEAPYRSVPCSPLEEGALSPVATKDKRLDVRLVPGLKQVVPADVMRGEETQIAGAMALMPGFAGVFCLPGTHSKWAQAADGLVRGFQTHMTGEMFALLSGQSVLRHGMSGGGWDEAAFDQAVLQASAEPAMISAALFGLRAEGLIAGLTASAARARLSGLLIGTEIAAARPSWQDQPVVLIGAEGLSANYARALALQGVKSQRLDATACTLAGLSAARGRACAALELPDLSASL